MAMEIEWDVVEGSSIRDKDGTLEILRPVIVTGMPQDCSDVGNPLALTQALLAPGMPAKGTAHSAAIPFAYLEERNVESIGAVDACRVVLVYVKRTLDDDDHTAASNWSLTDATQGAYVHTYATSDGSRAIKIWYKAGGALSAEPGEDVGPPSGAQPRTVALPRFRTHRVITASSMLRGPDWDSWKAQVRAASGKINSDTWGSEARGTWLCLGPTTRYVDPRRRIVHVQISFVEDPKGHYPMAAWINERGAHPADCNTEAFLRGTPFSPPAVGTIKRVNGLTIASVQEETAFSPIFAFTPTL